MYIYIGLVLKYNHLLILQVIHTYVCNRRINSHFRLRKSINDRWISLSHISISKIPTRKDEDKLQSSNRRINENNEPKLNKGNKLR